MSTITNTEIKQLEDYTVAELATFTPEQLAGVAMDMPFSPITNVARPSTGEIWDTWDVAWDDETRTWDELSSFLTNTPVKLLGGYTMAELATFTPEQLANTSFDTQFSPITNTPKP